MIPSVDWLAGWKQVLPQLGVDCPTDYLPVTVKCPLCASFRLRVYPDHPSEWGVCARCGVTGSMIEFAAAAWKLDLASTCEKLAQLAGKSRPPAGFAAQQLAQITQQKAAMAFWGEAQARHPATIPAGLQKVRNQLNISSDASVPWLPRGGQFIGYASQAAVAKNFFNFPGRRCISAGTACVRHGPEAVTGPAWDTMLVVPFWRLPGQLAGFVFIGGDGCARRRDYMYYCLRTGGNKQEAGLGMLSAAFAAPQPQLGPVLFAIPDAAFALQRQLRWLRTTERPLPIVIPYADTTRQTVSPWPWLVRDTVIFWSPRDRATTIGHARVADGLVSTWARYKDQQLQRLPSLIQLKEIKARAIPWQYALQQMLVKAPAATVETRISRAGLRGPTLHTFLTECPRKLRDQLSAQLYAKKYWPSVRVSASKHVFERNGCWVTASGDQLCDCNIHVERIYTFGSWRECQGYIRFHGKNYPFREQLTKTLRRGLFSWADAFLTAQGAPATLCYSPVWDTRAFDLACRLHPPETLVRSAGFGWDPADGGQFRFPAFSITARGLVSTEVPVSAPPPVAARLPAIHPPGHTLQAPVTLSQRTITTMSARQDEVRIVWALLTCIVHNMLGPALNHPTYGTILAGEGAQAVGRNLAGPLGCAELPLRENNWRLPNFFKEAYPHRCPVYVPGTFCTPQQADWLLQDAARKVIIPLSWYTDACVLGLRGCWNIIRCDRPLGSPQFTREAAAQLLPAYLRYLCQRRLHLLHYTKNQLFDVMRSIAEWFEQEGGDPRTIADAEHMLSAPGRPAALYYFAELLAHLWRQGRLICGGDTRKCVLETDEGIWIPQPVFSTGVRYGNHLAPDILVITELLRNKGVLLDKPAGRRTRGWLLQTTWWKFEMAARAVFRE